MFDIALNNQWFTVPYRGTHKFNYDGHVTVDFGISEQTMNCVYRLMQGQKIKSK